jgi:hypothetical protein
MRYGGHRTVPNQLSRTVDGGVGDQFTLVARAVQVQRAWSALPRPAGDRGTAPGKVTWLQKAAASR